MILLQKQMLELIEQITRATYARRLLWRNGKGCFAAEIRKQYRFKLFVESADGLNIEIFYLPGNMTFSGSGKVHYGFVSACVKLLVSIDWQRMLDKAEHLTVNALPEGQTMKGGEA